jgi:hypothetical protein
MIQEKKNKVMMVLLIITRIFTMKMKIWIMKPLKNRDYMGMMKALAMKLMTMMMMNMMMLILVSKL